MTGPSLTEYAAPGRRRRGVDPDAARRQGPRPRGRRRPQRLVAPLGGDGTRAIAPAPDDGRGGASGCCATGCAAGTAARGPVDGRPLGARAGARASSATCPVVLLGHSMGARTAVHVADDAAVRGVVALAPWFPPRRAGRRRWPASTLVAAHGSRDRITSSRGDPRVRRARRARSAPTATYVDMGRVGHYMLRRAAALERGRRREQSLALLG